MTNPEVHQITIREVCLPFPTMARTKQKARVSTGGTAPQINLNAASAAFKGTPPAPAIVPSAQLNSQTSPEDEEHNNVSPLWSPCSQTDPITNKYCYKCLNGGFLVLCDFCPRALCTLCIKGPPVPPSAQVKFMCRACSLYIFKSNQPFYVS